MKKIALLGLAGACVVLLSPPAMADLIDLSALNLVGTSQIISGGTLRLTPNFDPDPSGPIPAGAAWTTSRYNVADGFSANFQFQMSDPTGNLDRGHGGDGIAFLIQNSAQGDGAIGVGAGGMGFLGITDSLAIMLDTYQNSSPNYYGDPSNNYISVNTRGTDFNAPHHFCTDGLLTADSTIGSDLTGSSFSPNCTQNPTLGMTGYNGVNPLSANLDDGLVHNLGLIYSPGTLDVYLDSALALSVVLNLGNILDLENGSDAFLGFTAGTRFAYQNQDILSFDFTPVPEPASVQFGLPMAAILLAGMAHKWKRKSMKAR